MIDLLKVFLDNYLDFVIKATTIEFVKLIDVIDISTIKKVEILKTDLDYLSADTLDGLLAIRTLSFSDLLEKYFQVLMLDSNFLVKFFYVLNVMLVKIIFLRLTPLTFWVLPSLFLFLFGVVLLFFIKPNGLNLNIWLKAKFLLLLVLFYQFILLFLFFYFFSNGLIIKVGYSLAFTSPYNIQLIKLFFQFCVIFALLLTIFFFLDLYKKNVLLVKPELVVILFFLGFGSNMVFFQNDLFSMFLYFEIISFCIYGLLFLQKWTNTQLHALIRYVLFSLWVSTCYILGTAFYISANNTTTNLSYFWEVSNVVRLNGKEFVSILDYFLNFKTMLNTFSGNLKAEFEIILALSFILLYFLFKLGVGPFYSWTIEVYNACPANTLFVVSLLPKIIYFPMLFFVLFFGFIEYWLYWSSLLFAIGVGTIFIGAAGILLTDKLKEIYAWSSITHSGNLLLIVSCLSNSTLVFLSFYLVGYYVVSLGFILLMLCLWNWFTGWLIKSVNELGSINFLNSNFYILVIILLASASGFTPFVSFFMKFSVLTIISTQYSVLTLLLVGLLNIVGSIAYLRMLRNIVGFNKTLFNVWANNNEIFFIELKMTYRIALLFNFIIIFIVFGFIFFKDFIYSVSFYTHPVFVDEIFCDFWLKKYGASNLDANIYLPLLFEAASRVPASLPVESGRTMLDILLEQYHEDCSSSYLILDDDLLLRNLFLRYRRDQQIEIEIWKEFIENYTDRLKAELKWEENLEESIWRYFDLATRDEGLLWALRELYRR